MVRKSLADLLREEVNKQPEGTEEAAQKKASEKETPSRRKATTKSTTRRSSSQPGPKAAASKPSKTDETDVAENGHADAALVSQLQQDLDQVRRREARLAEQLEQLQTELEAQHSLISSLKEDLRKHQALAEELKEAKDAALHLAEANSKLTQEIKELRQVTNANTESGQTTQSRDRAAPNQPARQSLAVKPPQPERSYSPEIRRRQEESLAHPMFPAGPQPGQLTNQDLGWVD